MPAIPLTEKAFQAQVVALASYLGWTHYHTHDSRRSPAGFPDLVLVKAGEPVLFVELKTDVGKLTPAQRYWIALLDDAEGCEVWLWQPKWWHILERRLRGERLTQSAYEEAVMRLLGA